MSSAITDEVGETNYNLGLVEAYAVNYAMFSEPKVGVHTVANQRKL